MKKPKTYEEAILQLEQILGQISDESTPLEETLKLYAQAASIMEICNQKLTTAKLEIETINKKIQEDIIKIEE